LVNTRVTRKKKKTVSATVGWGPWGGCSVVTPEWGRE